MKSYPCPRLPFSAEICGASSPRLQLTASAIALLLLFFCPGGLRAQQAPPQGWPQGGQDPNGGQYAPPVQPGYPQQNYAQPGYPQPGYPAPNYPQSGYAQPYPQQQYAQPYSDSAQQYAQPGPAPAQLSQAPLNTEQLEQLVAPIALYPDTLVAQMLAASTYPAQVVDADHWRQAQGYAPPEQVAAGANAQTWDPSLKALTAFPQLLAEMDQNIRWTIALGNAYYNQPQDVLDVVQVMRQRAQTAGNLQSSPQEAVTYDQGYIQVAPANPQVVYLPAYDPWTAYGQPVEPYRGFSLTSALGSLFNSSLGSGFGGGFGSGFGSGAVRFGLGIAMSAFNRTPFGLIGWGLDWLAHSLLFHNSNYYSHSTTVADWGLPHGGPRAYAQRASFAGMGNGGYRPSGNYGRQVGGYNGYNPPRAQGFGRTQENNPGRYAENRPASSNFRNYGNPGNSYGRPAMEAYNRAPQPIGRPLQFSRPAPASNFYGGPGAGYGNRPSPAFNRPQEAYRAPAPSFQRNEYGSRSSESGRGFEDFRGKPEKSGGSHFFGGGREEKAPKAPKMDKHFGGGGHSERGHSGGLFGGHSGGHSGGHGGGGHHR